MKIFILTEGGADLGFGHIARCSALYSAFLEFGEKPLMMINGDNSIAHLLNQKNAIKLDWNNKKEELKDHISPNDIVVIDSYQAPESFYQMLADSKATCVYLDDTNRIDYPKGIVVNPADFSDELNYPAKNDVAYLLGTQYALLRKEFWIAPTKKIKQSAENVLITLGGSDKSRLIFKIINTLRKLKTKIKIIINECYPYREELLSTKDEKIELISCLDTNGMKKIMEWTDIAISAGGQTLFELTRMGVPTIAIATANNQMANIHGLEKRQIIEYSGVSNNVFFEKNLIDSIEKIISYEQRKIKSEIGQQTIDGQGAKRTVRYTLGK